MKTTKAIFLDRDGTINEDFKYVYKISDCKLIKGAKNALKIMREKGFILILITNQSGIGRGFYTEQDCHTFNSALEKKIDLLFDAIYICPHTQEDKCTCRKPGTKNVLAAQKKFGICLEQSYFIGDKESDIICGKIAGTKTVYVGEKDNIEADYKYSNILTFAQEILCQK